MDEQDRYIQMLISILEKQVATLTQVLEVTKDQERLAVPSEFDENLFDETLSRKDILIIRLNELDDGFVSVYERVRKEVLAQPGRYRGDIEKIQSLIRRCTDLGMEIQTLETRNRDKLEVCFAGKKQEYSARQTAATVAGKYHAAMRGTGYVTSGNRFDQDK